MEFEYSTLDDAIEVIVFPLMEETTADAPSEFEFVLLSTIESFTL